MTALAQRFRRGLADRSGTAAVEFAMIMPAFIVLIVGAIYTGQLLYSASSLRYAVEAAARCAAVNTTICTSTGSTQTYAAGKYFGPGSPTPAFVASSAACGQTVSGTVTYTLNTGVTSISIPLSASACFND
jgi:Flp pilus assembly protein TadG